jgi:hypothetical protein
MQGDYFCNDYKVPRVARANHRRYKLVSLLFELRSDILDTIGYPEFHIPRKLVGITSQVQPKYFCKASIVNLRSTISNFSITSYI